MASKRMWGAGAAWEVGDETAPHCHTHPETKLICPKCIGGKGAEATNAKHGSKLSEWGKRGGLAKKKPKE